MEEHPFCGESQSQTQLKEDKKNGRVFGKDIEKQIFFECTDKKRLKISPQIRRGFMEIFFGAVRVKKDEKREERQ